MLTGHERHRVETAAAAEHPRAPMRMEPDQLRLRVARGAAAPDANRNRHHADVMHQCGLHQDLGLVAVEIRNLCDRGRKSRDTPRVPGPLGQLQIRVVTQGSQRPAQRLTRRARTAPHPVPGPGPLARARC